MTDIALVYWSFCLFPLAMLAGIILPLVPRTGIRFWTTPTREQSVTLGLLAFSVAMAVVAIRKPEFAVFMALCGAAVLFQSWGPKVWRKGRVGGAYLAPLKVRHWRREGEKVLVRLSAGAWVKVKDEPRNREFLAELEALLPEGESS